MSQNLLRKIVKRIKDSKFFTIMADETADIANVEQLVVCIRWVDDDLEAHEEFIGLHPVPDTKAETIFRVLKVCILFQEIYAYILRKGCMYLYIASKSLVYK